MADTPAGGAPPGESGRDLDAEALARVLDGLEPAADADDAERAAHDRAEADVAAIARAFGLMGDALAAPVEPVAAAAVPVSESEAERDAVVIPLAARLRKRAPVLAAAASLIAVVGLGTVLVNNNDLGGSDNDSATAKAPAAAVPAPDASAGAAYDDQTARSSAQQESADALSAPPDAAAPAAAAEKETSTDGAPAEEPVAPASGEAAGSSAKKASTKDGRSTLDVAVSCNRGVFIGRVLSIAPSGDRYTLRIAVSEWISPSSGATVREFTVGQAYANTDDGRVDLTLGQEWLFVVPRSQASAVRAFAGPDYSQAREQVAAAQERTAGDAC